MNRLMDKIKGIAAKYFGKVPDAPKSFDSPGEIFDSEHQSWRTWIEEAVQRAAQDKIKYQDYELMDSEIPEISAALDVMADFVVYPDNISKSVTFKVKSNNRAVQKAVDDINAVTRFPYEFHSIVRETCKYGDDVEELLKTSKSKRILGFKNVPLASTIFGMKNGVPDPEKFVQQIGLDGKPVATLSGDEALHFSLPTDRLRAAQFHKGVSRIEKARLIYRQLRLMEEGVMISRLSRSNQQYGIVVDVGELYGDDVFNYLDKYKKRLQRRKYIDQSTGRLSYKYNPLSVMEDLLVPTRQGSGSNIIPLNSGAAQGKQIEDIQYFQNKLIYSAGVPKILIGKEEDVNSKATSDIQFICFYRTVRRIQMLLEPEILRFYREAMKYQGIPEDQASSITIEWPLLGTIDEERKWRIEQMKINIGTQLTNTNLIDDLYFYLNYMNMSEDQAKEIMDRLDEEQEEVTAEIDAQVAAAVDMSNPDPMSAANPNDPKLASKVNGKKKAQPLSQEEESKVREEAMNYFKGQMSKKEFENFERFMKVVNSDEKIRQNLIDFVELTRIRHGDLS